jgi:hypothetical protein
VIVRQDSGLGNIVAGAVLANAAHRAHANPGYYPSPAGNAGNAGNMGAGQAGGASSSIGFFGLFVRLFILALVCWAIYFAWKRLRRRRDADKPNYTFERN